MRSRLEFLKAMCTTREHGRLRGVDRAYVEERRLCTTINRGLHDTMIHELHRETLLVVNKIAIGDWERKENKAYRPQDS